MKEERDFFQKIQIFSNKYLLLMVGMLVLGIGILSIFTTAYLTGVFDKPFENTSYRFDNPIYIIAITSVVLVIIYAIQRCLKKINTNVIFIALIIVITLLQFQWVNKIKFIPISDQLSVIFLANDLNSKNYDSFRKPDSYFGTYPFQLGFIYYVADVFKHLDENSNLVLQQLNVGFSSISLILMYRIICNLFENKNIRRLGIILLSAFSIYFLFFNVHVYGNIPGLTFSMIAILCTIKYLKNRKKRYIGLISLSIAIAILLKSNYNIFLCGIIACLGLDFLRDHKLRTIAVILIIICTYMLLSFESKNHLEKLTGDKIPEGIPMINYVYMGMEPPADKACGWYTQGSVNLFSDNNYNQEKTKKEAVKKIELRAKDFLDNPKDFLHYYSDKIASTWLNPTFQVIWCNYPGVQMTINENYRTYIQNSPRIQSILSGDLYKLEEKCFNVLQSIIFIFASYGILKNYKKDEIQMLVLPIIFLGGFVFHILWETKAIYVLQYYFLLIPYASYGLYEFYRNVEKKFCIKDRLLVEGKERKLVK